MAQDISLWVSLHCDRRLGPKLKCYFLTSGTFACLSVCQPACLPVCMYVCLYVRVSALLLWLVICFELPHQVFDERRQFRCLFAACFWVSQFYLLSKQFNLIIMPILRPCRVYLMPWKTESKTCIKRVFSVHHICNEGKFVHLFSRFIKFFTKS